MTCYISIDDGLGGGSVWCTPPCSVRNHCREYARILEQLFSVVENAFRQCGTLVLVCG